MGFLNAHPESGFNFIYSTPRKYTDALYNDYKNGATSQIAIKHDDFFSYADLPHAYWTGYYSSRASFKRQIREFGQRM